MILRSIQLFLLYLTMFFAENEEAEVQRPGPIKMIYVYTNGCSDEKAREFHIRKKSDNFREIKNTLGFSNLRLFNSEGVEYFSDDIQFIKSKTVLYASKGEEFNQSNTFGEYKMIKIIGEGGFGQVQLAKHRQTGEQFAIKIIKAEKLGTASDIDSIFLEAETLKTLKHDNIVRVHNCLTLKNMQVALVMEYLEGGQLLAFVQKEGFLKEETALIIFKQIVKAMSYCHVNGLIHRDLKLQNMLLVSHEELKIKIIDFGIAGVMKTLTWDDLDIGSLGYMAPQCFINSKEYQVDGRIDVWSSGIILYAMLTGDLPFKGNSNEATIEAIKSGKYKVSSKIAKQLSEPCLDVLSQCLIPDPRKRPKMEDLQRHPWISGQLFQAKKNAKILTVVEEDETEGSGANMPQILKPIKEEEVKQKATKLVGGKVGGPVPVNKFKSNSKSVSNVAKKK